MNLWSCVRPRIFQVAGTAASIALQHKMSIDRIPMHELQFKLLEFKQILTYFDDVSGDDKAFDAVQFLGTRGFFNSYSARCRDVLTTSDLEIWNELFFHMFGVQSTGKTVKRQSGTVSIMVFKDSIMKILNRLLDGRYNGVVLKSDVEFNDNQLYENRDEHMPMLRGEACMGYYALYQILKQFHLL